MRYGYRVPFRSQPPLSSVSLPLPSYSPNSVGAGFVGRGVRFGAKGGHRDRASFPGVLQSPLCHPQSHWELSTCHRSLTPQQLGGALPFSHGDCPVCSPVSPARRLDGIPGPPGCLPSGSGASSFTPLPEVLRGRCGVPVSRTVLLVLDGPSGVHPRHGSCILDHASSRISSPSILRRLVSPGLHLPGTSASEGLSPLAVSSPRHSSESFEEFFDPDSDSGLSRDDACDFSFEGFPDPQEGSEVVPPSSGVPIRPPPSCVGLASSPRGDVIFACHNSRRPSPHAISPASPQCVRSSAPRGGSSVLGPYLPAGSSVVVRRLPSLGRPSSGRGPPQPLPFTRHVRPGLGRCSRQSPPLRLMVSPLLEFFDQPERVVRHSLRGSGFSALPPGSGRGTVLGQLHSPGIPAEARRDLLLLFEHGRSGTPSPLRVSVGSTPSPVHSRPSQCSGGLAQPSLSSPRFGVDFVSSDCGGAPLPVASHHRSLHDLPEPSPAGVLLTDVRPAGCGHRCNAAIVGWPPGLRLPTFRPPSSGVGEGSGLSVVGADAGGSILASAPLVPGPSRDVVGDSLLPATKEGSFQTASFPPLPPEPVHASANCLSYLRQSARQAGFSEAVASQLTHCRRRSTPINYQAKWVVYRSWCHRHGHSVSRPTVAKVADFLLYLRRSLSLSYSSIASYRSMLSGVCRFVLPELSSRFVLHDLLRSFRLERPLSSSRVPPWDLLVVLRFLRGPPFEPLASASLRPLTQKVLFLVSLATAWRVGEL